MQFNIPLNVKDVVRPIRAKDGKLIADNSEMCNVLNDFFASVFTDETGFKDLPEIKNRLIEENYM